MLAIQIQGQKYIWVAVMHCWTYSAPEAMQILVCYNFSIWKETVYQNVCNLFIHIIW